MDIDNDYDDATKTTTKAMIKTIIILFFIMIAIEKTTFISQTPRYENNGLSKGETITNKEITGVHSEKKNFLPLRHLEADIDLCDLDL